ncbi:MAG: hypothetical protein M3310_00305 [Actinomycetota bacterium]|nr:hypothetical protein [Actinomycetota bacterium]
MNRYFRRLQQFGKSFSARRSQSEMTNTSDQLLKDDRTQDEFSVRAKNSRHGKVTADKWNQ